MHDRETKPPAPSAKTVIVQAITRLNIGGPGRHVLDVATGLGDQFDVSIATGTPPDNEGELPFGATTVNRLPMVRAVDPQRDAASVVAMRRLLRSRGADLVHSHTAKAGTVSRLAVSSMRRPPRTVHTFHGHVLAGYFSPRVESFFAQVERRLARRTDRLITVSADVRDSLLELGIGRPAQYEVLPLGIDLAPYLSISGPAGQLREALGIRPEVPLVGVSARLAPIKGHDLLFDSLARLPGVHLAVLGDGNLREELETRASQLDLGGRVHFTGWWDDMPSALADLDIAVLTSRNEGTPMSLIEASAAGCPVVATDVGGVADIVRHDRTGLLLPPGQAAPLTDALRALLDDPQRRRRLGAAGRKHVRQHFGLRASLQRLSAVYDQLLAGSG